MPLEIRILRIPCFGWDAGKLVQSPISIRLVKVRVAPFSLNINKALAVMNANRQVTLRVVQISINLHEFPEYQTFDILASNA